MTMLTMLSTADHVVDMLTEAYDEVRGNLGRAAQKAKHYYDARSKQVTFKPGDLVWVYNPRRYQGRTPKWQRCSVLRGPIYSGEAN